MVEIFIYLFYSNALRSHYFVIIVFVYNLLQNKRTTSGKLILKREHFFRNVMVSVGVSRVGKTNMIFIDPSTKVNSSYYCRFVLGKSLLPDMPI